MQSLLKQRPTSFSAVRRIFARIALSLLFVPSLVAAQSAPDTRTPSAPLFTRNDIYLGAVFVLATAALAPFDQRVAHRLQQPDYQERRRVQRAASAVRLLADPGSVIIGASLYGIGRVSHTEWMADVGLHSSEAILAGQVVTGVIKTTAGRARPYVSKDMDARDFGLFRGLTQGRDYQSFPSGHTLAAFAAASAVTAESGRWKRESQWIIGPLMYGGASAVALSRLYNNEHWASDVILAAGIGTFAGNKVVRYQHRSNPGNKLDRWLLSGSISTGPDGKLQFRVAPGIGR